MALAFQVRNSGLHTLVEDQYRRRIQTSPPQANVDQIQKLFTSRMNSARNLRAIHGAAKRGSNDIISYQAENGALLDVSDNQGRTAIDWAEGVLTGARAPFRKPETIALLQQLQARAALPRE